MEFYSLGSIGITIKSAVLMASSPHPHKPGQDVKPPSKHPAHRELVTTWPVGHCQ